MFCVLCDPDGSAAFERLICSLGKLHREDLKLITAPDDLDYVYEKQERHPTYTIIDITICWEGKFLQDMYGLELAAVLRRDFRLLNPIVFFSPVPKQFICPENDCGLLDENGIGFLSQPVSREMFQAALSGTSVLTIPELTELVLRSCSFTEQWRSAAHLFAKYIDGEGITLQTLQPLLRRWAKLVSWYVPNQKSRYELFVHSLETYSKSSGTNDLKFALQGLDEALTGVRPVISSTEQFVPGYPPRGYSQVLIADDEEPKSLIRGLQEDYCYTIVGHARGFKEAERQLKEKKPGVVLADYYFKKHSHDTIGDKKYGQSFMMLALRTKVGTSANVTEPIVAAISKTSLDPAEIPTGVVNCSGIYHSTDAEFVHHAIWTEARRRNPEIDAEPVAGKPWSIEYTCRQRLEACGLEIPLLIKQWRSFGDTIRDTLTLIRDVSCDGPSSESELVASIQRLLLPYAGVSDFSFADACKILAEIEHIHHTARGLTESESTLAIRNILHGKIEQFSSVTAHIAFVQKSMSDVVSKLSKITGLGDVAIKLEMVLDEFDPSIELLPHLERLGESIEAMLSYLPKIPTINNNFRPDNRTIQKVNVLIMEDNPVWRDLIIDTVDRLKSKLSQSHEINSFTFSNITAIREAEPLMDAGNDTLTIAVVDICLPANEGDIPTAKNGIELISRLTSYAVNLPVIVFTTKASLTDIASIGKLGVPDTNFILKDYDSTRTLLQVLLNQIEKSDKYFLRRSLQFTAGEERYDFYINDLRIPFRSELSATFQTLYELTEEGLNENEYQFTAEEIALRKLAVCDEADPAVTEKLKHRVHSDISEIRKVIHETARKNNMYINVRELVETLSDEESNEFFYALNAQLPSFDDEDSRLDDEEEFRMRKFDYLFVSRHHDLVEVAIDLLKDLNDTGQIRTSHIISAGDMQACRPDILCFDLEEVDQFALERPMFPNDRLGIIVMKGDSGSSDKRLVRDAITAGIQSESIVSIQEIDWANDFLTKLDAEKRRVFLREYGRSVQATHEPIVKILEGSDLEIGLLKLNVDGRPFTMRTTSNNSIARIIGLLLKHPKQSLGFNRIKRDAIGSTTPVTTDEQKGWTRKIRNKLQMEWIRSHERNDVKKVLESSSNGLKLNVHVIDMRVSK